MNKDNIIKNLIKLDETLYYEQYSEKLTINCYIVGGSALILLDLIPRATSDIDILSTDARHFIDKMDDYNISTNVAAFLTNFPDEYTKRAKLLNLPTKIINYYVLSLEDIIISKLIAHRDKDMQDITQPDIINIVDWEKLDELVELTIEGMVSDYDANEIKYFYNEYKERFCNE